MFLTDWTLAALRFAGILGPSVEMQEERARQSGAVLKYVDNKRGGSSFLHGMRQRRHATVAKPQEVQAKPTRETLLKQLKDEAYAQGYNQERAKLKLILDLELQAHRKRIEAEVRQQVIEHSAHICDLAYAAFGNDSNLWRPVSGWIRQGLPLPEVAESLHKAIAGRAHELYESERAQRVTALAEMEVRLGLKSAPWSELRVC